MGEQYCQQCGEYYDIIHMEFVYDNEGRILCCKNCLDEMSPLDVVDLFGGSLH